MNCCSSTCPVLAQRRMPTTADSARSGCGDRPWSRRPSTWQTRYAIIWRCSNPGSPLPLRWHGRLLLPNVPCGIVWRGRRQFSPVARRGVVRSCLRLARQATAVGRAGGHVAGLCRDGRFHSCIPALGWGGACSLTAITVWLRQTSALADRASSGSTAVVDRILVDADLSLRHKLGKVLGNRTRFGIFHPGCIEARRV